MIVKLDSLPPIPSVIKEHAGQSLADELMGMSSGSDGSDDFEKDDEEQEQGAAQLPPPPPAIPSDYLKKEEVVRKLAQGPGWMEERKLKKVICLICCPTLSHFLFTFFCN